MELFTDDLYSVLDLINKNDDTSSIIKVKTISKQYLAYYIYRIIVKYIKIVEMGASYSDLIEFMKFMGIPKEHNMENNYPIVGKMINDNDILEVIIIKGIDMLKKTDKYLNSLPNMSAYKHLFEFLNQKDLTTILKDLIDLQKLIPGLSVSAIRPIYLNDDKI